MATQDPTCSLSDDPASEDTRTESAVLAFVLEEHPAHLTIPELSLAINRQEILSLACDDAVERAIRELVGAGLLHCQGAFVLPSRAALYFERLELS
ncbi:MAG TPA: hypothetical protein VHU86_07385 [Solirubrobacterales bacterium]|jgi:hypothetical protein|nr:hypothetical protein [Solirubrobacterales bacterium]